MLFTRCPNCETTFRITDQALRKAAGQVRCGRCACVFDAYAELREQRGETGTGEAGGGAASAEVRLEAAEAAAAVDGASAAENPAAAENAFLVEGFALAEDAPVGEDASAADDPALAEDAAAEGAELVADDAADAPDSDLDPDAEWFATATLFIVEAAASERTEPAPSSSARTSPRPPPPVPNDDVLDDYSVAAVLEQIESSSVAAESEAADEEKGAQPSSSTGARSAASAPGARPAESAPGARSAGSTSGAGSAAPAPGTRSAASESRAGSVATRAGATSTAARTTTGKTAAARGAASKDRASARAAAASDAGASAAAALSEQGAKADAARAPRGTRSAASPWHPGEALEPPPFAKPAHRASGVWLYASLGALLLLGAQLTNHFRSDLARVDALGPALRNLYGRIGIDLIPRWDLAGYRIVDWVATAEPNAKGRGSLHITAQIRNEGRRAQPYPLVHLQLKDRWEKSVASRMFQPPEYLPMRERADRLMPPGATARAELEVVDPGPDAYGFELDVCILQPDKNVRCAADDVFR